ncbi:S-adenosylmethionine:tRNA ribosyltransferase-isomerase [Acholeplasma oculi]|uniref:S-adenosylmethionine:tRNA ribosyltransferase-isomerase n=1 Tax=Acholeplasma oculi TaxID=35623 RepID=A0A061ACJ7_9MOLU|nr:tRNA preQ1(34) S-adenosylmethionine ribosyltransferase-isomerase QueA [Acholeplasma oculi]CDR31139.1 S-adenosylmethionine:tRNA ribosyltransferase-isomerase, QueA [Acholeplasma oculi]SKC37382.1 S-adenosylmethionine:tRNA ribosyltransferase-isomerase [Acholeplasma oculi]SUT90918.1 S-adenosylmethionine:tRNA ribosyltransferase-isomerase [Acholeplasma oculi]
MKIELFDYHLPKENIAQHPEDKRDHSKLLVIDRKNDLTHDKHFYDILDEFTENDVLVMNNTRVIPARLLGHREGLQGVMEVLLLNQTSKDEWEALTKPAKKVKLGTIIVFGDGSLKLKCVGIKDEGIRVYEAIYEGIFLEVLDKLGTMPLPPYITEQLSDKERYQTVYAKYPGSAAAPTAGLHFTKELLENIKKKGVEIVEVTLHVGLGTFRPVQVDDVLSHHMHSEAYEISKEAAERLNTYKKLGKRIIAVGTTSVRTLESNYKNGFHHGHYSTDIFIYPGYQFKVVDAIITNFHLPKSTLIMLVSAFYNREKVLEIYNEAVKKNYRFFSFGDSMFLK